MFLQAVGTGSSAITLGGVRNDHWLIYLHSPRYGPRGNACTGGQYAFGHTDRTAAPCVNEPDAAWVLSYLLQDRPQVRV